MSSGDVPSASPQGSFPQRIALLQIDRPADVDAQKGETRVVPHPQATQIEPSIGPISLRIDVQRRDLRPVGNLSVNEDSLGG